MTKYILFFITFFFASQLLAENSIRVKPLIEVQNVRNITLGLISEFKGLPEDTQKNLASVVLGNAPKKGEKRVFSSPAIAMAFRKHLTKEQIKGLKLVIPSEVVIRVKDRSLKKENIKKELSEIWKGYCADCSFKIQMMSLPYIKNISDVEDWSVDAGKEPAKGNFNLPMYIKMKGQNLKQYWLTGHSRVYKRVPVLKKAMAHGERFSKKNVHILDKDITFAYDSTPNLKDIYGKQCSQAMRAGAIIWQNRVLREKALTRGEIVKLVIGNELFELSTLGKAESDAYVGDSVRVKNLKTNKVVSGLVVRKGEVRLE